VQRQTIPTRPAQEPTQEFPIETRHNLLSVGAVSADEPMVELIPTGLAVVAVVLVGVALLAMTVGSLRAAGFCFLCASLVIYFRETRYAGGRT